MFGFLTLLFGLFSFNAFAANPIDVIAFNYTGQVIKCEGETCNAYESELGGRQILSMEHLAYASVNSGSYVDVGDNKKMHMSVQFWSHPDNAHKCSADGSQLFYFVNMVATLFDASGLEVGGSIRAGTSFCSSFMPDLDVHSIPFSVEGVSYRVNMLLRDGTIETQTSLPNSSAYLPLDQMKCSGPFPTTFFDNLTARPDLNNYIAELGRDPNTIYKYELVGDVFTSPPTFNGDHTEEYVFLTIADNVDFSVSRFVKTSFGFTLMAQHPVEHKFEERILQYRHIGNPENPPDWVCRY